MVDLVILLQQISSDFVACVFLLSGIAKIGTLRKFRSDLLLVPYMPVPLTYLLGFVLPPLEIGVGIGLLIPLSPARAVALGLLVSFCVVSVLAMRRQLDVPCDCFGAGRGELLGRATLLRSVALIALVAISSSLSERVAGLLSLISAITLGVCFTMLGKAMANHRGLLRSLAGGPNA